MAPNLGDAGFSQFDPQRVSDLESAGGLGPVPARIAAQTVGEPVPRVVVGACGCCLERLRTVAPARRRGGRQGGPSGRADGSSTPVPLAGSPLRSRSAR